MTVHNLATKSAKDIYTLSCTMPLTVFNLKHDHYDTNEVGECTFRVNTTI